MKRSEGKIRIRGLALFPSFLHRDSYLLIFPLNSKFSIWNLHTRNEAWGLD